MSGDEKPYPTDYNVLAFIFNTEKLAAGVAKDIDDGLLLDQYHIVAKAVVTKDENGEINFDGPSGYTAEGAAAGFVAGGALGLIGGPVGLLAFAVGGAVVGGIAGHFRTGYSLHKEDLEEFGESLKPKNSAYLLLASSADTDKIKISMEGYNATVVTLPVGAEMCAEISSAVAAGYGK